MPPLGAGLFLIVLGLPAALFPYPVARQSERVDAIGSKTSWTQVEPTEWNVLLTRVVGVGFVLVGLLVLLVE